MKKLRCQRNSSAAGENFEVLNPLSKVKFSAAGENFEGFKHFSKDKIEYCLKFNEPYKHFAGKFALKEATKKALEIKLKMTEIITSHIKSKPIVIIPSEEYHLEASVSHDGDYAIAILISKKVV